MNYPTSLKFEVENIFASQTVEITLYSGLTTFVGTNGSGKTQTLKALRDYLKNRTEQRNVRYLSSNRIGTMEQYRSKVDQYYSSPDDYSLGDQNAKKIRHEIETANGDFFTMDDQKDVYIKVAERLSVLFKRHIFIRWDAGKMKVFFDKSDNNFEYSIVTEASGLVNIISILAALFDRTIDILLIDEPEVSLHPQLQSYLLREINYAIKKYNKTIIMSTHSAQMIEIHHASDLRNYIFFSDNELPKQIDPNSPELNNKKLKDFLLRVSLIYNEAFFAKKVMLIEGASDMILCRALSNRLNLNLDVAGSQIIPVEGKGQFPIITKFFRLIGKDVCILTDLDGFTDDNDVINLFSGLNQAKELANENGLDNLQIMIREIRKTIDQLIRDNKDDMISIYETHPYWINQDCEIDDIEKIIRRALIAQLFTGEKDSLSNWPHSKEWIRIKTRITTLYGILEKLGCFILRRGAIESYYSSASNITDNRKPSAAALEVSHWEEKSDEEICTQFDDIVRSLKFTALENNVDESFAVKKELLSELALILGILHEANTNTELLSNIKQIKGSSVSLFDYKIITENGIRGVEISLKSKILDVSGFPFKTFTGDNVNKIVDDNIRSKSTSS